MTVKWYGLVTSGAWKHDVEHDGRGAMDGGAGRRHTQDGYGTWSRKRRGMAKVKEEQGYDGCDSWAEKNGWGIRWVWRTVYRG